MDLMEGGQGWISVMDSHSQAVGPPLTDNSSGGSGAYQIAPAPEPKSPKL